MCGVVRHSGAQSHPEPQNGIPVPNPTDEKRLIPIKDAADQLSISYWLMWRLVRDAVIPSVYQGRTRYVTPEAIRAYVAALPTEPTKPAYKR